MTIPLPFFQPMDALPGLQLNDLMDYLFTFFLCSIRLSAFLISSGPFLGAALAIGLIIGIIQAATSIQEMTLSFVPKIVLVILAMGMMANFFLVSLTDYFQFIFETISGIK